MGMGYKFKCENCGYEFTAFFGVGFMYPKIYQETRTAVLIGKLGKEIQKFLQENPDGEISAEETFGRCTQCGNLENVTDLTMYLPKENSTASRKNDGIRWSGAMPFLDVDYVTPEAMKYKYKVFAKYPHKCKRCGGDMEILVEQWFNRITGNKELECPNCRTTLKLADVLMGD